MWQVVMAAPSIENADAELLSDFDLEAKQFGQNFSRLLRWLIDSGSLRVRFARVEANPTI